ncbi:MAG: response regulator [Gammaproteobacteria bacterium]
MTKILIVDDSPTEVYKFRLMLEEHGFEVLEANTGVEGVALVKELNPDVVLMDVVMPGLNGFQATRQITKNEATKHIPVIIVTTKDQETDRVWGQRQGAYSYLTKPVEENELVSVIESALTQS